MREFFFFERDFGGRFLVCFFIICCLIAVIFISDVSLGGIFGYGVCLVGTVIFKGVSIIYLYERKNFLEDCLWN